MSSIVNIQIRERQVGDELINTCDGREIHAELGVARDYTTWAKAQIKRARLAENRDYLLTQEGEQLPSGTKWKSVYHFTLDAAKHISMMSGTDRGHEVREYFIACERAAKGLKALPQLPYAVGSNDKLNACEQDELRGMLTKAAQELPKGSRGSFMLQGWSKLKAHFKVSYRNIPRAEFTEALSIVSRHIAEFRTPLLPAPSPSDKALLQAMNSVQVMASSVADLSAAVLSLSGQRQQHGQQQAAHSRQAVLL